MKNDFTGKISLSEFLVLWNIHSRGNYFERVNSYEKYFLIRVSSAFFHTVSVCGNYGTFLSLF